MLSVRVVVFMLRSAVNVVAECVECLQCGVVLKQGKFCNIDRGRTTTYIGMYF